MSINNALNKAETKIYGKPDAIKDDEAALWASKIKR